MGQNGMWNEISEMRLSLKISMTLWKQMNRKGTGQDGMGLGFNITGQDGTERDER